LMKRGKIRKIMLLCLTRRTALYAAVRRRRLLKGNGRYANGTRNERNLCTHPNIRVTGAPNRSDGTRRPKESIHARRGASSSKNPSPRQHKGRRPSAGERTLYWHPGIDPKCAQRQNAFGMSTQRATVRKGRQNMSIHKGGSIAFRCSDDDTKLPQTHGKCWKEDRRR